MFESTKLLPEIHRKRIHSFRNMKEEECVGMMVERMAFLEGANTRIENLAYRMIEKVRGSRSTLIESFMREFGLSTEEGIALMCLSEALLRIPDDVTIDDLLFDKVAEVDWSKCTEKSSGLFIHVSTWMLLISGYVMKGQAGDECYWTGILKNLLKRVSAPVIRTACKRGIELFGDSFVLAEAIEDAVAKSKKMSDVTDGSDPKVVYSYDMLGEASRTKEDSEKYMKSYLGAIRAVGTSSSSAVDGFKKNGISVKLSAISPRYEFLHQEHVMTEMFEDVLKLCLTAKELDVPLCLDAEECHRVEILLMLFKALAEHPDLKGWNNLGVVVQSYQKAAPAVIDFLQDVAISADRVIPIRLVKGAYWDYEIKFAQENGLNDYPVFTRKIYTDISYAYCAKKLIESSKYFYPGFATHNSYTIASVLELTSKGSGRFEFQRLCGMGESLYNYLLDEVIDGVCCRIYSPVGDKNNLLPYLIRRILENGANSSFVHKIGDKNIDPKELVADPFEKAKSLSFSPNPIIPLPVSIFGAARKNSCGIDMNDSVVLSNLAASYKELSKNEYFSYSIINGKNVFTGEGNTVPNPSKPEVSVGVSFSSSPENMQYALSVGVEGFANWSTSGFSFRADILRKAADLLEKNSDKFMHILTIEAGKVLSDAISEVREAVDFLRYYAQMAEIMFEAPTECPGYVGEMNVMIFEGRGVFLCISPWNFPLAIFIGQIAAALVCGNTVLAKPSEQTTIVAYEMVKLMHAAGVPESALQLVIASGRSVGDILVSDQRIAGVVFTGSTQTASVINRALAQRGGAIVPFIAETGGLNAMIVDSSALLEQVTVDIINSAFKSSGQRCSALRLLFIQEDVFDAQVRLICGAMNELLIGDPMKFSTDLGPVIDAKSLDALNKHISDMNSSSKLLARTPMKEDLSGFFLPPHMYELNDASDLKSEVFGPILHVVKYKRSELNKVIETINNSGYGLTLGIHSRVNKFVNEIIAKASVGNVYVNRNQVGAVVGVQPFGGRGLSGTGPKAGGHTYLYRFVAEKTISVNLVAVGGDVSLMMSSD